jgi:hypothetical protein
MLEFHSQSPWSRIANPGRAIPGSAITQSPNHWKSQSTQSAIANRRSRIAKSPNRQSRRNRKSKIENQESEVARVSHYTQADLEVTMTRSRFGLLAGIAGAAFATWWMRHRRSHTSMTSASDRGEVIFSNSPQV